MLETLKAKARWVCYRKLGDKKIPYQPRLPLVEARVNDEASWGTHDDAVAMCAAGHVDGKGYVLGDGEAGIDIDDCRNPETGELTPEAQRIIAETNSYTEISPSKCGIKIFVQAWLGKNHARKGLEIYGHHRYFTVTEDHVAGTPTDVEARAAALETLIAREFEFDTAESPDEPDAPADDPTAVEEAFDDHTEIIDANRNVTLTRIGGSLRRIGLDDDELLSALLAINQSRCKPPMDRQEVTTIARSIGKYPPSKAERAIDWMNQRHMVVFEAGRTAIFTERKEDLLDRFVYDRSSAEDIRLLYRNHKINLVVGKKKVVKALGDYWLDHPGRKEYRGGVIFDPENKFPDTSKLNLWRGYTVQPKPGEWTLFREHLLHVICRDEQHVFDFVIRWLARLFQKPGRPAETGIALRGRQGTGKGIVGRVVGSIFGQHYLHVTHAHHLVGHFNAHLQDAVFVFADEAVAPQDKAAVSALKTLVSEPNVTIERKGKDAFTVRNVIHLFMASNHDWVLPAEMDERRWTMLDVDPSHANDHKYFQALLNQMKAGGREAMLHDLLAMDLTGWNHRTIPHTKALLEQKQSTMSPLQKWWLGKLEDGALINGQWPDELPKDTLYSDCIEALERMGVSRRPSETEFWTAIKKMTPEWTRFRKRSGGRPTWFTKVPPLDVCRAQWEALTKTTYQWTAQAAVDDGPRAEPPHRAEDGLF